MTISERLGAKARNMQRMMALCRVSTAQLNAEYGAVALAAAARACIFCKADEECRLWLSLHGKDECSDPPSFCPNATRFLSARERLHG